MMKRLLPGIAAGFWLIQPPPLLAEPVVLEEVEVTARKIAEDSQTVPISMTVVTPAKLESINAFDFTEIERLAPSLQIGRNTPASATLKIRNVGPAYFALAFPASVAVYVDGVPQAQPGTVFATMLDVQHIEVLNGPQGTLYGKNAPAGLVSIYTANPHTDGIDGYYTSSYSSWDTWHNTTAINVPLVEDRFAMRLAGMYAESDGYMDNVVPGVNRSNGKEDKGLRSKLLWRPTEAIEVLFSYYYADLDRGDDTEGYEGPVPDPDNLTDYESEYDDYDVFKGVPTYSDTEVNDFNLNSSLSLDTVTLSFLGQYQDLNIFHQEDTVHYRVIPPPEVPRDYIVFDPTSYSLEFTADGDLSEDISYVGGLFYSDDDTNTLNSIMGINIEGSASTDSWGIYTNWTYRFNDHWDTSLGARYSDVDFGAKVFGFIPELGEMNVQYDNNYSDPSYSFKVRYFPRDDILAYLAIDTGFRSGMINPLAPLAEQLAETLFTEEPISGNLQTISEEYYEFDQEDSIAYELGLKGTFLEQRLRWNLAAFMQYYDDYQHRTGPTDAAVGPILSGPFSNLIVNIEDLEVYGFETEVDYLIDDNWSVFTTAAYARPEIQEFSKRMCIDGETTPGVLVCPADSGDRLNEEPVFHSLSQLRYRQPLGGSNLEIFGLVTMEYYDEPYQKVSTPNIEDILTFDLTLGINEVGDRWTIKVWSKNITDETIKFSENVILDPGGTGSDVLGYSADLYPPRSYGLTAEYRFKAN